jgi:hypothetical protein
LLIRFRLLLDLTFLGHVDADGIPQNLSGRHDHGLHDLGDRDIGNEPVAVTLRLSPGGPAEESEN